MLTLKPLKYLLATACTVTATAALADVTIPMNFTAEKGVGAAAGTVKVSETAYGLLFTPNLRGLAPGAHGFHVHVNPSCDNNGMAAGGHFDPKNTNKHLGPYNDDGHMGDLPVLIVDADGIATTPAVAPRLHKLSELSKHALMVHHDGDNYSDTPKPLGGGGSRMACGVIE